MEEKEIEGLLRKALTIVYMMEDSGVEELRADRAIASLETSAQELEAELDSIYAKRLERKKMLEVISGLSKEDALDMARDWMAYRDRHPVNRDDLLQMVRFLQIYGGQTGTYLDRFREYFVFE